jgi:ketosteroid isomerase-like protein
MKDTPDLQLREQLDATVNKFDEAFNNNDAVALADLFTEDAVLVTDAGLVFGREAIEKHHTDLLQKYHFSDHIGKADQYSPHITGQSGNEMWATGEWSCNVRAESGGPIEAKGFWSAIYRREEDAWKKRMDIYNVTPAPAPAATPTTTTTPSN